MPDFVMMPVDNEDGWLALRAVDEEDAILCYNWR